MRSHWRDLIAAFLYIKGAYRKMERDFLPNPVVTGQRAMHYGYSAELLYIQKMNGKKTSPEFGRKLNYFDHVLESK
ncbi:hypothetical protein QYF61_011827, partial [Mycteria americana]